MNVLIRANDEYFKHGIKYLLDSIVSCNIIMEPSNKALTHDNINCFDLVVLKFTLTNVLSCKKQLNSFGIKRNIVFVDDCKYTSDCLQGITIIKNKTHPNEVEKIIRTALINTKCTGIERLNICIHKCNSSLTKKEKIISNFMLSGMGTHQIAEKLCLQNRTVVVHLKNIIDKLHLKNKQELIRFLRINNDHNNLISM